MKLIIEDDEGHKTTVPFVREEITVGRQDGNTIRLTERNVSRKHARFFRKSGGVFVEDLRSHNGIKVNGDRIEAAIALKEGDLVQIGDYDLAVQDEQVATKPPDNRATVKMDALEDLGALGDGSDPDSGATSRDLGREARAQASRAPAPEVESDPSKPAGPPRAAATAVVALNGAAEREIAVPPAPPGVDIPPHDAPRLVMVSTELAGREFACIRSVLTIGRGDECDVPIDHRSLSREHARLERRGAQWNVVDLGSPNRVQVNGEEYADTSINNGDVITLGHVKLRFVGAGEEYTYVPEGSGKRSPMIFVGLGVAAVAVIGAGVYFGFVRKSGNGNEPVAPDNPKTAPAPSLLPKTTTALVPPTENPKVAVAPTPTPTPTPEPAKVAVAPEPKAVPKAEPKPPDDVVVPDLAPTPTPEPKALVAPRHTEKGSSHSKGGKAEKGAPAAVADTGPTPQDQANQLRTEANDLMGQGQYDGAITKLRQALKLSPNDPLLHKSLGGCLANSGEMDQAAKEYKRFIELAPNSPDVPKVRQVLDAYMKSKGG